MKRMNREPAVILPNSLLAAGIKCFACQEAADMVLSMQGVCLCVGCLDALLSVEDTFTVMTVPALQNKVLKFGKKKGE